MLMLVMTCTYFLWVGVGNSSASNACVGYERGAISSLSDDVRDQLLGGALE